MEAVVAQVGSAPGADVVITDPTIAARHASLRLQGGVWMLEDLRSQGGSWVDEVAVTDPRPMAPGSLLRLGTVELIFDPQDAWGDSPPVAPLVERPEPAIVPAAPAPLFMIDRAPAGSGWLPWVLVGGVVLLAVAAVLLAGGSR